MKWDSSRTAQLTRTVLWFQDVRGFGKSFLKCSQSGEGLRKKNTQRCCLTEKLYVEKCFCHPTVSKTHKENLQGQVTPAHSHPLTVKSLNSRFQMDFLYIAVMAWTAILLTPIQSLHDSCSLNLHVSCVCVCNSKKKKKRRQLSSVLWLISPIVLCGDVGSCPHCFSPSLMPPQTQPPNTCDASSPPDLPCWCWRNIWAP